MHACTIKKRYYRQSLSNFIDFFTFYRNFALLKLFLALKAGSPSSDNKLFLFFYYNCIIHVILFNTTLIQLIFTCKRVLTFFKEFLFLPPSPPSTLCPKNDKNQTQLGPLIIFKDIGREMVAIHFLEVCVTVLHLLQKKAGQRALCIKRLFWPPPPPMRPKIEIRFSPNAAYKFIRTMAQV